MKASLVIVTLLSVVSAPVQAVLYVGFGTSDIFIHTESPFSSLGIGARSDEVPVSIDYEPGAIQFESIIVPEMTGTSSDSVSLLDPNTLESKTFTATIDFSVTSSLPSPVTSSGGLVAEAAGLRFSLPQFSPTEPVQVSGTVTVEGPTEMITEPFSVSYNVVDLPFYRLDGLVLASPAFPDEINLQYSYGMEAAGNATGISVPIFGTTVDGVPIEIGLGRGFTVDGSGDGTFVAIPEPSQTLFLLGGLALLGIRRRSRAFREERA